MGVLVLLLSKADKVAPYSIVPPTYIITKDPLLSNHCVNLAPQLFLRGTA